MTCIIGLEYKGKCYIGGDSAGSAGYDYTIRADEKVFRNNGFLMGFTSSFRMGQILRYGFKPPKQEMKDDMKFMVNCFIPEVKKSFKEGGFVAADHSAGGEFLVAYKNVIYHIYSDFQVGRSTTSVSTCGCGGIYAMGAMDALEKSISNPVRRIKEALRITENHNSGVRGPFIVKTL